MRNGCYKSFYTGLLHRMRILFAGVSIACEMGVKNFKFL